jgi:hypothetical protein
VIDGQSREHAVRDSTLAGSGGKFPRIPLPDRLSITAQVFRLDGRHRATIEEVRATIQRWCIGFLVGSTISSLPWLVSQLDIEWLWPVNLVMIPGTVIAIASAGGNVHTYNEVVLLAANVMVYTVGTYLVLKHRHH